MRANVLSDQDWQSLIAQQKQSALTIKRFCQSKGVTTGPFPYYQKIACSKLRKYARFFTS